ncbi:hypothetical protein C8Q76DRAFT_73199 [Earliella scabrosa]|nr:hypothetical protein C8Q76DRAFT_73199 [Earliella scabrosa]
MAPTLTSISTRSTFNMSSTPNARILALVLVLILTFVFCIGSIVVLVLRRRRMITQSQPQIDFESLETKADTHSEIDTPSSSTGLPPSVTAPRPLSQESFVSRSLWRFRVSRDGSAPQPRRTSPGLETKIQVDKEVEAFEDFVQPQLDQREQQLDQRTYGSSSSLTSVALESPVLEKGEFFAPPSSPSAASLASATSMPSLSSSSSFSSPPSTPSKTSSCWEPQTPPSAPAPVRSTAYSTKRLSLPFDDAWIEKLREVDVTTEVHAVVSVSPLKPKVPGPSPWSSIYGKPPQFSLPRSNMAVVGFGRGRGVGMGRPSSVVGVWRGVSAASGIGLGLGLSSSFSSRLSDSEEDLSVFDDADDECSSIASSWSSRTVIAGVFSDADSDADFVNAKRLSDLVDALSTSFSLSISGEQDGERCNVLDGYDEDDYDDSDDGEGDLDHLAEVVVHLGRSRREAFVYAL